MKRKRTYSNAANRRAAKRIKYANSFLTRRSRLAGPWPDFVDTELRYYDTFVLNPTTGSIQTQVMRANSLFDPDFTGTGHQPRGFDQWAAMYTKYIVTAAKVRVTAMYSGTGNAGNIFVSTNTASAPYGSDLDAMEDNRVQWKTVSQFQSATLYESFKHKDFFISNPYDDSVAGATTGANPSNSVYFIIGASSLNASQDPGDFTVMVQISYKVRFYDHVEPGDS